ncbi:MAG: DUF2273 domain-containing protein [Thermaerobacter sp.]|mgnify:CR=1 FL=1|nr:hypothetical protein [Bacillota bacterium]REJ34617.1 MAG: hypothetical protein DIU84_07630 [Bacillota bacterium]
MDRREDLKALWEDVWPRHAGKITGAALGLIFGVLVKWVGLFWTLFIAATTWIGYSLGARLDDGTLDASEWWERIRARTRR